MNLYGWSKHLFDLARGRPRRARSEKLPPQWAGLKFFNVFGPNEYHKGEMMSLVAKRFDDVQGGPHGARCSSRTAPASRDGEQRRDFIYVDDAVAVVRWLLGHADGVRHLQCRHRQGAQLPRPDHGAVRARSAARRRSNMSTCRPRSATATSISPRPRSTTCARAGYNAGFTPLEEAVKRYVAAYLDTADRYR